MSSLEKIFKDSINGPRSIEELNTSEWIALISIHNKKFIEALVECGSAFDLYLMDTQRNFRFLSETLGASSEEAQLIEMNNIYANNSTFLFPEELISNEWVESILALHNKGYLNFPPRLQDKKNLLDELKQAGAKTLKRAEMAKFPVLIPTLNVVKCDVKDAKRHFVTKTPQYARYTEAILAVKSNPKAMKSIHDVFISLIYIDEVIVNYETNIAPHFAETSNNRVLSEFLAAIKLNINNQALSDRELNEALQFSRVNMLLNWLFKANKLNKKDRVEFLKQISLQYGGVSQVRQYMIDNELLI